MMKKKQNQNHLDYWSARSDDIFRYLDRKDVDFFKELNQIYQEQAVEMQKALFDFVSKYSEDGSIGYQEALQRLKGTDLSDYQANAQKYREQAEKDPELLKRLNEQYASAQASRLESLQLDILFRMGVARGIIADKFDSYLQKMALMGYKKAMGGRSGTINAPALKELVKTPFNGYNYSQQLWGNTDNLIKDLKKVLKSGFVRGDHPRTMARDLARKYKVANSRAETLVRTDGTMIVNRAAVQRYKDAGLKYYRILVHLDNRTTEICRKIAADDKRYLIDEIEPGITAPPFHFNCRSGVIPDEEELNGDIAESDSDFSELSNDLSKIWDDVSGSSMGYDDIKRNLADKYVIGQLPNVAGTREMIKRVVMTNSDLAKSLEKHGSEFPLDQMLLLEELVSSPDYIADNTKHHNNSILLYKEVPERLKYLMEAALIPKDDGSYIIHYHKIKKQKLNKLKREQKILYSKDNM
ncbi:minor capsid protein [Streptococcus panodentis]|uniref:Phage head morphogenesis protein n=1 Tax=Streptococcus panodentis TaxID=1581472 RepID=A0ABS5AX43_9STRE|nr:minor capsid protein [Streptococcus panodentis]MBP2621130.1 phage head morphogenesis protein [Streptococcus panodentis]